MREGMEAARVTEPPILSRTIDLNEHAASYTEAVRLIRQWAREAKRIEAAQQSFLAIVNAANERRHEDDSSSNTAKVAELMRPFQQAPRAKPLSRAQREAIERQRQTEIEARRVERLVLARMRRGTGEIGRCRHCTRICRGPKCKRCKEDPALITARGKETRQGRIPEAQPPATRFSDEASRIDEIIASQVPAWAANALKRSFLWAESTEESADELGISEMQFASRVRGAVLHVVLALAND